MFSDLPEKVWIIEVVYGIFTAWVKYIQATEMPRNWSSPGGVYSEE